MSPNAPRTPNRVVRVPDELWSQAKMAASDHGESVADVVRRALQDYVDAWLDEVGR